MGGPGSGSWYRWDTRRVIDTVACLDVRELARQGALRAGVQARVTWRGGRARLRLPGKAGALY